MHTCHTLALLYLTYAWEAKSIGTQELMRFHAVGCSSPKAKGGFVQFLMHYLPCSCLLRLWLEYHFVSTKWTQRWEDRITQLILLRTFDYLAIENFYLKLHINDSTQGIFIEQYSKTLDIFKHSMRRPPFLLPKAKQQVYIWIFWSSELFMQFRTRGDS